VENKNLYEFHEKKFEGYVVWYSSHAGINRGLYLLFKVLLIVSAASIPVLINFPRLQLLTGSLGALIVVLEGTSKVFQFHNNWLNYRKTWQSLKLEEMQYDAGVGDYKVEGRDKEALFVSRVASILSEEYSTWTEIAEKIGKGEMVKATKPTEVIKGE
jgi:hypothetical protein